MANKNHKTSNKYYQHRLELAVILSLVLIITAFLFIPRINIKTIKINYQNREPFITMIDLPATKHQSITRRLEPPRIPQSVNYIPSDLDEIIIFDNIEFNEPIDTNIESAENGNENGSEDDGEVFATSLPYLPRQILDVVPDEIEEIKTGILKLLILVDESGTPIDHQEMFNSLEKIEYTKRIIAAIYKSKWQPVTLKGKKKRYWIEKSYEF